MLKIYTLLIFLYLVVGGCSGDVGHRIVENNLENNHYYPPMACSVEVTNGNNYVYLNVKGIDSTIFCRRVVNYFTNNNLFIASETKNNKSEPVLCNFSGVGFTVDVVSEDVFGQYVYNTVGRQAG